MMRASATSGVVAATLLLIAALLGGADAQAFKGITYSPFWDNNSQFCRPAQLVAQDLPILRQFTRRIRIFSISACPDSTRQILDYARANGMSVFVGLFFGNYADPSINEREINALPALLSAYDESVINAISVGNEPISIEGLSTSFILGLVSRVRSQLSAAGRNIPVTVVENFPTWLPVGGAVARALAPVVDFIAVNLETYFEGVPITCSGLSIPGCQDAVTWTVNRYREIADGYGKRVVITEAGWPTLGERSVNRPPYGFPSSTPSFLAVPSIANAQTFINSFLPRANTDGIDYYYFEMFDGNWKRIYAPCRGYCPFLSGCVNGFCEYDYHWGLYTSDRQPKCGLTLPGGTSSPNPPFPPSPSTSTSPSPPPPPGGSGGLPAGYRLVQTPITAFQQTFTTCQGLNLRFVGYLNPQTTRTGDKAAVEAALRTVPRVYVNDNTVGGQCPVVTGVNTESLQNCFQNLPFVCGPL